MNALDILSELLGWTYFIAWSFSLYPQLYLNWRRQSVRGLSSDFLNYSIIGFLCYTIFTLAFFFNKEIQDEYDKRHNAGNLVRSNDVAFAIHGLVVSLVLLGQTYIYKGIKHHLTPFTAIITWLTFIGCLLTVFSVHYGNSEWIHVMYYLSYVKLGSDTFKFLPQIWLNYKRKSTQGWSAYLILMDTLGGALSILQLVLDAYIEGDWSGIAGDSVKLGLGVVSMTYGLLFMSQKWIFYRQPSEEESPLLGEQVYSHGTGGV
ncbi:PQ loop repeat-domain-containing protein [Chlamydoabsidia padenii]|nr:PQ loop repeat-domain-containing protein [Chlamydoabsidia padenii]